MEGDPIATVRRLQDLRRVIAEVTAAHGAQVFGVAGDSEMVAFDDAHRALQAALEIRARVIAINATVRRAERMLLRLGLGYGQVISEETDLFGDTVNIAARVMALAEANEILVTEAFYRQVAGEASCGFVSLGRHKLKNIHRPIGVYRVIPSAAVLQSITALAERAVRGRVGWLSLATAAAAAVIVVVLVPMPSDINTLVTKAVRHFGLERWVVTEEREAAFALADGELLWAVRLELEREIAARKMAETSLSEALAKAEDEAKARAEMERLLRLAEERTLSVEEKGLLAEQLALVARMEAEAAVEARKMVETKLIEALTKAQDEAKAAAEIQTAAEAAKVLESDTTAPDSKRPNSAMTVPSGGLPGDIRDLQRAFVSFSVKEMPRDWPFYSGTDLNPVPVVQKASVVEARPPEYVLVIDWFLNTKVHGLYKSVGDKIAVRWQGSEVEVLHWIEGGNAKKDMAKEPSPPAATDAALVEDGLASTTAGPIQMLILTEQQKTDLDRKVRAYLRKNWIEAGLSASWGHIGNLGDLRVVDQSDDLYRVEAQVDQGWHGLQRVQLSLKVVENTLSIVSARPVH
jgi:hypothetical protein